MREIKFRAFRKESPQRMIYADAGFILTEYKDSIMQYTSIKDKNGTEIYEGDILSNMIVVRMEWDSGMSDAAIYGWVFGSRKDTLDKLEVIGNIHDNPELLDDGN